MIMWKEYRAFPSIADPGAKKARASSLSDGDPQLLWQVQMYASFCELSTYFAGF